MSAEEKIAQLRKLAKHAREVAGMISDKGAARSILRHAEEYESEAAALEAQTTLPPAACVASGEPPIARAGAALKPEAPPEPEENSN